MDIFPMNSINNYNKIHSLPSFVKEASVITEEDVAGLPQTAFADPRRKLPIHTKVATWFSHLAYHSGAVVDPTGSADVHLKKAADFWGIGEECRKIQENLEKDATPREPTDEDFALVANYDGHKIRQLPVAGPGNVKQSAEQLVKSAGSYPLAWRKRAAQKIIKRATDLSVKLVDEHQIQQMAGVGMAKASEIVPHLQLRARMVKDANIRERLNALATEIGKLPSLDNELLSKMAEAVDLSDRASGLYQYYGRGIDTPEAIFHRHSLTEMKEKQASLIRLTNGQGVDKQALAKMSADKFTALGDDFVGAIKGANGNVDVDKAEAIVPTLPADDANLFVNSL